MTIKINLTRTVVLNTFRGCNYDDAYLELIIDVLDRIDDIENMDEDTIYQCIDDACIYYTDQWTILKNNCLPQEANWNDAIEIFLDDVKNALCELKIAYYLQNHNV